MWLLLDEAVLNGEERQFRIITEVKLLQHTGPIGIDGFYAEVEEVCYLLVGISLCQEAEDLELPV